MPLPASASSGRLAASRSESRVAWPYTRRTSPGSAWPKRRDGHDVYPSMEQPRGAGMPESVEDGVEAMSSANAENCWVRRFGIICLSSAIRDDRRLGTLMDSDSQQLFTLFALPGPRSPQRAPQTSPILKPPTRPRITAGSSRWSWIAFSNRWRSIASKTFGRPFSGLSGPAPVRAPNPGRGPDQSHTSLRLRGLSPRRSPDS